MDFGNFTWKEIFELRESGFVSVFRKSIFELEKSFKNASENKNIKKIVNELNACTIDRIIRKNRPNVKMTILKALLSAIPIPIVNPIGLGISAIDIKDSIQRKKMDGWMFFIQEAKQKTERQNN